MIDIKVKVPKTMVHVNKIFKLVEEIQFGVQILVILLNENMFEENLYGPKYNLNLSNLFHMNNT